jgi:predicted O-methyltransferase YrrM
MRSFQHWNARYLLDRSVQEIHTRTHQGRPWFTRQANQILDTLLRPTDEGLEFGSGRSTVWLAGRVRKLTSVEHDPEWHGVVSSQLRTHGRHNVDYVFEPETVPDSDGADSGYAKIAMRFPDRSLNFVIVDGRYRDACAALALPKIEPGGFLILDNVNWYLPSDSRSPNSRRPHQGPDGSAWCEVDSVLRTWRSIWTSDGVTDTAFFIRPCTRSGDDGERLTSLASGD